MSVSYGQNAAVGAYDWHRPAVRAVIVSVFVMVVAVLAVMRRHFRALLPAVLPTVWHLVSSLCVSLLPSGRHGRHPVVNIRLPLLGSAHLITELSPLV